MRESDFRRISVAAVVLLVVVRLAIGWQLLYEGLWKLQTQGTSAPWTAEPYLKNAQGPLRDYFRSLTGDPNDLNYLDYDTISARWTEWANDFKAHYGLNEDQARKLDAMVSGPADFRRELEELPEGVDLDKVTRGVSFNPESKRLIVDGTLHFTPREKRNVLRQVDFDETTDSLADVKDPVKKKFIEQIQKIYIQQSRLSFKERAMATLQGDPEWAGIVDEKQKDTNDEKRLGKIEIYQERLQRYEDNMANLDVPYAEKHLAYDWNEIQEMRSELVGPIQALEADMKWDAERLLTTEQLARGPLQERMTDQRKIDLQTMWALAILGGLLIAGLGTRVAAAGGAFLLFNFYLAYPPFPGYPQPPGPEHGLIINKNLIEVLILVAFVFLPSGRWFGIDAVFAALFAKKDEGADKA
ncbi:hypothetical protein [Rubinisphaera sp. JC750]|uniref:hypothetical protein n=1 Tax=Rubinisphaera sp. JC750 TaxID=2898658 RepID=UPI001F40666F|nr:hypothetical protein [Rubinisphaera sp. JC750]